MALASLKFVEAALQRLAVERDDTGLGPIGREIEEGGVFAKRLFDIGGVEPLQNIADGRMRRRLDAAIALLGAVPKPLPLRLVLLRHRTLYDNLSRFHVDDDVVGMRQRLWADPKCCRRSSSLFQSSLYLIACSKYASCSALFARSVSERSAMKAWAERNCPRAALTASARMTA